MYRLSALPLLTLFLLLSAIPILANSHVGLNRQQTKSISTDDFSGSRISGRIKSKAKKSTKKYYFVRKTENQSIARTNKLKIQVDPLHQGRSQLTDIGVTFWRMRPPKGREFGHFLPVLNDEGKRVMWLAERAQMDKPFNAGDRIRFAIESSVQGFVYVLSREIYTNSRFGRPMLVFPSTPDLDNSTKPGILVDIPSQDEDLPYFKIVPKASGYRGEALTIIVSPVKLEGLKADKDGKVLDEERLTDIEWNIEGIIFSRNDNVNRIFTDTESRATCGNKNRALGHCSGLVRELTRDDPPPQSIYRVNALRARPAVAFIQIRVQTDTKE